MKRALSSLLLASLCAPSSWSVPSGAFRVEQGPDVSLQVGEAANITCCWTRWDGQVRVVWTKNQSKIHEVVLRNSTNNCSTLIFGHATGEDSGRYICTVTTEIPGVTTSKGNGTAVTVATEEDEYSDPPDSQLPALLVLAAAIPSLLGALACFCALKRKRARAARVIYEVPHVDSDVDKHSTTSSRGSSQWCQVPVYESFDYFQHMETKESG